MIDFADNSPVRICPAGHLNLKPGVDFRAPDNRKDWPLHDNVRVKPLGPVRIEVEEITVPAFLLVRS